MTLAEYESDVKYLIDKFKRSATPETARNLLTMYLKAKRYTNDELLLLYSLADEQITAQQLQEYIKFCETPPEFLPPISDSKDIDDKSSVRNPYELIYLISRHIEVPEYPFDAISPYFLTTPEMNNKFVIAEKSLLKVGYFEKDGSWNIYRDLKSLVTFLNLLHAADIIKYTSEKEMDTYFSKRYKLDSIGAQMRLNKFKACRQFNEFPLLLMDLGLKQENLQGN